MSEENVENAAAALRARREAVAPPAQHQTSVPTSEILRYAIDLRSMTGGRGQFHAEHDHYDTLPQNLWSHVTRANNGS